MTPLPTMSKPHSRRTPVRRVVCLFCLPLLLTACQTKEDPRDGGFVDGVVGITTGGYDDYVDVKQDSLEAEQEESSQLAARAQAIETEQADLKREIDAAQNQLAGLQSQLSELRARLANSTQASAAERARLKEAEERAARADQGLKALSGDTEASLAAQKKKIKDLQKLIGSVATMVAELSG